jgi:hypothetical protein
MFRSRTECFLIAGTLIVSNISRDLHEYQLSGHQPVSLSSRTAQEDEIAEDDDMDGRPKKER